MRSLLNREQLRRRPETPKTIAELDVALINYQPYNVSLKVRYCQMRIIEQLYLQVTFYWTLATATEIYMDGTFSVSNIKNLILLNMSDHYKK